MSIGSALLRCHNKTIKIVALKTTTVKTSYDYLPLCKFQVNRSCSHEKKREHLRQINERFLSRIKTDKKDQQQTSAIIGFVK